jgi:hypothetical protein
MLNNYSEVRNIFLERYHFEMRKETGTIILQYKPSNLVTQLTLAVLPLPCCKRTGERFHRPPQLASNSLVL